MQSDSTPPSPVNVFVERDGTWELLGTAATGDVPSLLQLKAGSITACVVSPQTPGQDLSRVLRMLDEQGAGALRYWEFVDAPKKPTPKVPLEPLPADWKQKRKKLLAKLQRTKPCRVSNQPQINPQFDKSWSQRG